MEVEGSGGARDPGFRCCHRFVDITRVELFAPRAPPEPSTSMKFRLRWWVFPLSQVSQTGFLVQGRIAGERSGAAAGEVERGPLEQRPYSASFGCAIQARVALRQPRGLSVRPFQPKIVG